MFRRVIVTLSSYEQIISSLDILKKSNETFLFFQALQILQSHRWRWERMEVGPNCQS